MEFIRTLQKSRFWWVKVYSYMEARMEGEGHIHQGFASIAKKLGGTLMWLLTQHTGTTRLTRA